MKKKPKVFISLNDELISELIGMAERTVIYAAPAVSEDIAEAIVAGMHDRSDLMIRVIVNADAESLRLGYGKFGGIKMLWNEGIDVRCAPGLRIGALIVDDRSWVFSPTPEIILEGPSEETNNAVNINPSFTKWLIHALTPKEGIVDTVREEFGHSIAEEHSDLRETDKDESGDEVLDSPVLDEPEGPNLLDATEIVQSLFDVKALEPQIGTEPLTREKLDEIESEIEERPPRQFDHAREILVYNGYLQFVDMKFSGGRLSARTIRLPSHLLSLAKSPIDQVEITATCKVFEDINALCPEVREFERKVDEVRRCYTQPLGKDLGSVILTRNKASFEKEVQDLHDELGELSKGATVKLSNAIKVNMNKLIEILMPLVLSNPPNDLRKLLDEAYCPPEQCAREYLTRTLAWLFPFASELIENFDLRCTFKDVTWEMLNQREFGDAIKMKFPSEAFTKLYKERNTIGERKKSKRRKIDDEDWLEQIDDEPTDISG